MTVLAPLLEAIEQELPAAFELRRELHRYPDPSGAEQATRDRMLAWLPDGDTELVAGAGAVRRIGASGPAVAVRAELDALRVTEGTGLGWASTHDGVMHACGHDVHMAALIALARAVARVEGAPPMVAVLQPREEAYPSGAKDLVDLDVLSRADVASMVAAHVHPVVAAGSVACTPGAVNAAADEFEVRVEGMGGHAAYPHLVDDPVIAIASIVMGLQTIVSRSVDPTQSAVVGVSTIHAGEAANAVPGVAVARGIVRTFSESARDFVLERIREVVDRVAAAHRCRGTVTIHRGEPVLFNDVTLAKAIADGLQDVGLKTSPGLVSYGADDFAYFSSVVPSVMTFVGVDSPQVGLHHSSFVPPDAAIGDVTRTLLAAYLAASRSIS